MAWIGAERISYIFYILVYNEFYCFYFVEQFLRPMYQTLIYKRTFRICVRSTCIRISFLHFLINTLFLTPNNEIFEIPSGKMYAVVFKIRALIVFIYFASSFLMFSWTERKALLKIKTFEICTSKTTFLKCIILPCLFVYTLNFCCCQMLGWVQQMFERTNLTFVLINYNRPLN